MNEADIPEVPAILEGWLEKRTVNVVNLKISRFYLSNASIYTSKPNNLTYFYIAQQFRPVYVSLTPQHLKYGFGESKDEHEQVISIKDISSVTQAGRCLHFCQTCSSRGGLKITCIQTPSTYIAGKWLSALISVGARLPSNKKHGLGGVFNFKSRAYDVFSVRRYVTTSPLATGSGGGGMAKQLQSTPKSIGVARVESLVVLECLSRTPQLLEHLLKVEGPFQKVVGVSMAVLLSHEVLTQKAKYGFPEEWLLGLINAEVGIGENLFRPYALMMREERMSSIALSYMMRIIFMFSPLMQSITSTPTERISDDDPLMGCASCVRRLKDVLFQSTPEANIVRCFARGCCGMSKQAIVHQSKSSQAAHQELPQDTAACRAEDYQYALLSGTLFLRVICPALVTNQTRTCSLRDGNVTVAAAAVLSHILLAECSCLCDMDGLPAEFFQDICSKVPLEVASEHIQSFIDVDMSSQVSDRSRMAVAKVMQKTANAVSVDISKSDEDSSFREVVAELKTLFDLLLSSES